MWRFQEKRTPFYVKGSSNSTYFASSRVAPERPIFPKILKGISDGRSETEIGISPWNVRRTHIIRYLSLIRTDEE
jgi:hypothetical protein